MAIVSAQAAAQNAPKNQSAAPVVKYQPSQVKKNEFGPCLATTVDSPETNGIYRVDPRGPILPPKVLRSVEAEFTSDARHDNIGGTVSVQLVVDTKGIPQDICLHGKPLGHGLDSQAAEAVRQYRFQPATKAGKPVPVRVVVGVNFHQY
jgi:TonB family protein